MSPHCDILQEVENKVSGSPVNTDTVAVIKGRAVSKPWSALVSSDLTLVCKVDEDLTTWYGSVLRIGVHTWDHRQVPKMRPQVEGQALLPLDDDFKARVRAAGLRKQLLSPSNSETL